MINFLAEISNKPNNSIQATPSEHSRNKNIYYLDINPHPESSYWTEWGGIYDNFTATQIELYYSLFLRRVNSLDDLVENTFFLDSDFMVYFNLLIHPWLYPNYAVKAFELEMFLSNALNPNKPSYNILRDNVISTRLDIPSINTKLSDNASGMILNQSFSISLSNHDGYFDDENKWNLFNVPVYIKKSLVENPTYDDFKTIRYGLVENTSVDMNSFIIEASDRLRSMEEPVCYLVLRDNYPASVTIEENILNKNIPIIYGTKKVKLQKLYSDVNGDTYIVAEYINDVCGFYNSDGNRVKVNYTFTNSGTITITGYDETLGEPESVLIDGYADNRLGSIIADIIERKSNIPIDDGNWNKIELDDYKNKSPVINLLIESGNVKSTIQNILKNDMAFLIQQSDGRLTIRRYGETYAERYIASWTTTKKPDKKWQSAQENYFSSCKINYNFSDKDNFLTYLYRDREAVAEDIYRRRVLKSFDTDLYNESDAREFAKLLADRYLIMRQTITLPTGTDTSNFELMDTVLTEIKINDRLLSFVKKYFIKEINPAQDILVLEEINGGMQ